MVLNVELEGGWGGWKGGEGGRVGRVHKMITTNYKPTSTLWCPFLDQL